MCAPYIERLIPGLRLTRGEEFGTFQKLTLDDALAITAALCGLGWGQSASQALRHPVRMALSSRDWKTSVRNRGNGQNEDGHTGGDMPFSVARSRGFSPRSSQFAAGCAMRTGCRSALQPIA